MLPTSNGGKLPLNPPIISTNENCMTSIDANDIINAQTITDSASNRDRPQKNEKTIIEKLNNYNRKLLGEMKCVLRHRTIEMKNGREKKKLLKL